MIRYKDQDVPLYDGSEGRPVAVIVVDPAGLDFIIDNLPNDDGFTQGLKKLRKASLEIWWSRA